MTKKTGRQNSDVRKQSAGKVSTEQQTEPKELNAAHKEMLDWLKKVKFRKTMFGGVEERDLWKKLEELNRLYESALLSERTRYDTMLQAYVRATNAKLGEYQKTVKALQEKVRTLEKQQDQPV
ncbi:MAG: hypothetical protein Q4B09_05820 [Lachnospiraceae bacterium]|nr:hypothetical protein [Lachnospiraceae bacterium]